VRDDSYPDAWAVKFTSREQSDVIAQADDQCQLGYAGCTGRAVTTRATLATDPVCDHHAACQSCAGHRDWVRG